MKQYVFTGHFVVYADTDEEAWDRASEIADDIIEIDDVESDDDDDHR